MRRLVVLGLVGTLAFTFVGSPASRAATVASNWPVGKAPFGLASDSSTGKIYVANSETAMLDGTGRTSVVDTALPPPSGGAWLGVAVDPSRLRVYLTNADPNAPGLFAYDYNAQGDLTPASTDPRIALTTTVRYAVTVDPVRHLIFAAGSDTTGGGAPSAFYVIDPDTLSVIHTTTISGFPMGIALAPSTNRIYVSVDASPTSGAVYAPDDATFAVNDTIP